VGRLITIYPGDADDFSTLGLGALAPTKCEVSWEAGGMYDLEIVHPVDAEKRWTLIDYGMIIKAPGPVREAPVVSAGIAPETIVTREIYRVTTNGGRLHLRARASTSSRILGSYRPGTQVIRLEVSGNWAKVIVVNGGATGYMNTSYLTYARTETEVIKGDKPGEIVEIKQVGDQLFRIYEVERDAANGEIAARAMHISYDLRAISVKGDYAPKNVAVETVVAGILSRALAEHPFEIHCYATGQVTGEFGGKSILDCLLEPETGIVAQTKARIIRDNYDIYLLPDQERDMGVELRYAKNLLGASMKVDAADIVTRIEAVGKTKDGKPLYLDGTGYVDSARIGSYPTVYAKRVEYDVQVGKDGISNATQARAKLRQLAQDDFAAGADLPKVSVDVDFLDLGTTTEYAQYHDLQAAHPYDTVAVEYPPLGISARLRLTKCTWDSLAGRYSQTTLGEIASIKPTTFGYDIARGAVVGTKIAADAVGEEHYRDLSIGLAKIDTAAIDTIIANSITALHGRFGEIVADKLTADELYVALAQMVTLMVEQITAGTITTDELYAELARVIELRVQQITAATISTDQLYAALADVIVLRAQQAALASVEADNLTAAIATISDARIDSADIGFAQIKDLVTGTAIITEGVGGKLYISRLNVTEANIVSLSVGELMVKGADGRLYRLGVDEEGQITNTPIQIEGADVAGSTLTGGNMIENTITTRELNVQNIFADNAMIRELIAANLDVGTLFAREATVAALNAADISGNASLNLYVKQADLSTYLRLTTGQVELGETDSPVRVQLRTGENAGLYIVEGTQANAYFGQNKARIERLEMGEAILIGNTAIVAQNDGDDVYWLGR
jgi:phage minor structural protein